KERSFSSLWVSSLVTRGSILTFIVCPPQCTGEVDKRGIVAAGRQSPSPSLWPNYPACLQRSGVLMAAGRGSIRVKIPGCQRQNSRRADAAAGARQGGQVMNRKQGFAAAAIGLALAAAWTLNGNVAFGQS